MVYHVQVSGKLQGCTGVIVTLYQLTGSLLELELFPRMGPRREGAPIIPIRDPELIREPIPMREPIRCRLFGGSLACPKESL